MKKFFKYMTLRIGILINILLVTASFAVIWYSCYRPLMVKAFFRKGNWLLVALFMLMYLFFGRTYESFNVSLSRVHELIYSQGLAIVLTNGLFYVFICLLTLGFQNPLPLLASVAVDLALCTLWSFAIRKWYFRTFKPQKTIIIYGEREGMEELVSQYNMEKTFDVRRTVPADDIIHEIDSLEEYDTVFLSGVQSHDRNTILKFCVDRSVHAYVIPRIGDLLMAGAKRVHIFHLPLYSVMRYSPSIDFKLIKRAADILVSAVMLIVLSPLLAGVAAAIRAEDHGPVFYRQRRLTKDGKPFMIIKFRSMRTDAEKDGVARLSTGENDSRITKVGRVIRKYRIDEFPQLLNILKGDLSLVGPRPERPEIAAEYEKTMPEFRLRLQAKAGLTGYAQVYGKYNTTPYDKLQMDLMYIANPSIVEDLRLIFATIKILFLPESTEGVAEGQTTALHNNGEKK